ncbi:MAG: hypothetical protein JWP57_3342 [Spirosoma sp.]|nr:hypothetical protein [Spirosoma sp.]
MATSFLSGCRVTLKPGTLEPDFYRLVRTTQPDLIGQKVYVVDSGDSLQLILPMQDQPRFIHPSTYLSWTFKHTEIDADVFTLPFKIRPSKGGLPAQLNSNFNAAMYVGRRIDLYKYRWKPVTPSFGVRELRSRGFGYGLFAGIGSSVINDFVTNTPIGIEYEGVILNAGLATIYDAHVFNIGLAVGIDYLTDLNRQQWIYQQKPWFGVLFGLNLN